MLIENIDGRWKKKKKREVGNKSCRSHDSDAPETTFASFSIDIEEDVRRESVFREKKMELEKKVKVGKERKEILSALLSIVGKQTSR